MIELEVRMPEIGEVVIKDNEAFMILGYKDEKVLSAYAIGGVSTFVENEKVCIDSEDIVITYLTELAKDSFTQSMRKSKIHSLTASALRVSKNKAVGKILDTSGIIPDLRIDNDAIQKWYLNNMLSGLVTTELITYTKMHQRVYEKQAEKKKREKDEKKELLAQNKLCTKENIEVGALYQSLTKDRYYVYLGSVNSYFVFFDVSYYYAERLMDYFKGTTHRDELNYIFSRVKCVKKFPDLEFNNLLGENNYITPKCRSTERSSSWERRCEEALDGKGEYTELEFWK